MNTNPIDTDEDPEDAAAKFQQPQEAELGRKFYWRNKELAAFSYNHQCALFRIATGEMSNFEHDFILLYLLLQPRAKIDQVRTADQITAFRLEVGEWVERERLDAKYEEIRALVRSILDPVQKAEELEPALPPGSKPDPSPNG